MSYFQEVANRVQVFEADEDDEVDEVEYGTRFLVEPLVEDDEEEDDYVPDDRIPEDDDISDDADESIEEEEGEAGDVSGVKRRRL